ncbi:MAG: hypothetical protein ABMB14_02885 [Myxococcota bacterium]
MNGERFRGGPHPERLIQEALEDAGDPAGAFLWRRVCRDLDGEVRIAVVSRDDGVTSRAIRALGARFPRIEWIPLRVESAGDALHPTLGAVDRLLSVHALVWATPATAPLGAEERAGMTAIVDAGAPSRRVVAVADTDLVAQMTDDPESELAEVVHRARSLSGADWEVLRLDALDGWVDPLCADPIALARERRRAVAQVLLRDARRRADQAVELAAAEVERVDRLLAAEDAVLDAERRRGQRTAAHLLGAMRRQTERLLMDLRTFLHALEADLAGQIDAVRDLDTVRRTLPHWLHHVVERWMADRLSTWRADVLRDLSELALAASDLERAELLVPALHTAPVRTEAGWGQRLGVTAAVGGGAALLAFGMWIPGLLAVTGGIAWSALGRRAAQATTRRALVDAATEAVRKMGQDADRLLRDQIATLEDDLDRLGEHRAAEVGRARLDQRGALDQERTTRAQRLSTLTEVRDGLDRRIAAMDAEVTP